MSNLVLELRAGDMMVINGAPIRFRTRSRIEIAAKVRFLFGKQIMTPAQANTPARRIYFALQTAHLGTPEERAAGLSMAQQYAREFMEATESLAVKDTLRAAIAAAEADNGYDALRLAREVVRHEEEVLGIERFNGPPRE